MRSSAKVRISLSRERIGCATALSTDSCAPITRGYFFITSFSILSLEKKDISLIKDHNISTIHIFFAFPRVTIYHEYVTDRGKTTLLAKYFQILIQRWSQNFGRMAERLNATVLKTVEGATPSRVRIPILPKHTSKIKTIGNKTVGIYVIQIISLGREKQKTSFASWHQEPVCYYSFIQFFL